MNTTEARTTHGHLPDLILSGIAGGPITEGIGAIATMALAIIGLAGVFVNVMAAVATIVIGALIMMEGGLAGVAHRWVHSQDAAEEQPLEMSGGVTAGFLGGLAGIVLGILALFREAPETLLAVAMLVFGASLLLGAGAAYRVSGSPSSRSKTSAQGMAATIPGGVTLVALAAIVLGILAIVGLVPITLTLAGLLSLGANALLSESMASYGRDRS